MRAATGAGILDLVAANAILSDQEKGRIFYHMGYGVVNVASLFTLGVPAISQTHYLVANALEHIPVDRIQLVREIVAVLDRLDQADIEDIDYATAKDIGELTLAEDRDQRIQVKYTRWAKRLSDVLIAPLNPYSDRFNGGGRPMNFRVAQ